MIIMGMYEDIREGVSESIEIMGHPFYAENITPTEPYNRREQEVTSILGGTERVVDGAYVHREFSFTTTVWFPTGKPNAYDDIFRKMVSKPVTVISKYMGGTFKAMVKLSPSFPENSPNHMDLDVTITEVPGKKSLIPGEKFIVPNVKKVKTKTKVKTTSKKTSKKESSKKKNKRKTKKKTSKTKGK